MVTQALVQQFEADQFSKDSDGYTPLHLAALYNVLDNTIILLKLAMGAADGDTPEFYNILNNDNVSGKNSKKVLKSKNF